VVVGVVVVGVVVEGVVVGGVVGVVFQMECDCLIREDFYCKYTTNTCSWVGVSRSRDILKILTGVVLGEEVCKKLLWMVRINLQPERRITDYSEESIRHFQMKTNLNYYLLFFTMFCSCFIQSLTLFYVFPESLNNLFYLNRITFSHKIIFSFKH